MLLLKLSAAASFTLALGVKTVNAQVHVTGMLKELGVRHQQMSWR